MVLWSMLLAMVRSTSCIGSRANFLLGCVLEWQWSQVLCQVERFKHMHRMVASYGCVQHAPRTGLPHYQPVNMLYKSNCTTHPHAG